MVDALGERADLRGGVLELGLQAGEPLGDGLEARVDAGQRPRLANAAGDGLAGTSPLPVQRVADRGRAARDRLAVPRQLEPSPQLRRLAGTEASAADLLDLVAQQLEPPLHLARLDRDLGQRRPILAPALDRPRHLEPELRVAAERVEQLALPALVEQPRLLVLAVDLDERPDRLREPRRRHRLIVQPRGRSPAGADLAGRDQRLRHPIEQRLHARGIRAVAHERRVRARAERQPQRVDEQALAGARLAGEHVEARARAPAAAARSGRDPGR